MCLQDEAFYQEKELINKEGKFFTTDGEEVEWIEEESFFFRLSQWEEIIKILEENPDFISPESRKRGNKFC